MWPFKPKPPKPVDTDKRPKRIIFTSEQSLTIARLRDRLEGERRLGRNAHAHNAELWIAVNGFAPDRRPGMWTLEDSAFPAVMTWSPSTLCDPDAN